MVSQKFLQSLQRFKMTLIGLKKSMIAINIKLFFTLDRQMNH